MEINNLSSISNSSMYMQLAQNRAQLTDIDKNELEKDTQNSYNKLSETSNNDQQDYQKVLGSFNKQNTENELKSADAQIAKTANLNKLLLQSQSQEGVFNEN